MGKRRAGRRRPAPTSSRRNWPSVRPSQTIRRWSSRTRRSPSTWSTRSAARWAGSRWSPSSAPPAARGRSTISPPRWPDGSTASHSSTGSSDAWSSPTAPPLSRAWGARWLAYRARRYGSTAGCRCRSSSRGERLAPGTGPFSRWAASPRWGVPATRSPAAWRARWSAPPPSSIRSWLRASGAATCAEPRPGRFTNAAPPHGDGTRPSRAPDLRESSRLAARRGRRHAGAEAGLPQLHGHALLLALAHETDLLRPRAARDLELVGAVVHLLPEGVAERFPFLERPKGLPEIVDAVAAGSRLPHLIADLPHGDPGRLEGQGLLEPAVPVLHGGTGRLAALMSLLPEVGQAPRGFYRLPVRAPGAAILDVRGGRGRRVRALGPGDIHSGHRHDEEYQRQLRAPGDAKPSHDSI